MSKIPRKDPHLDEIIELLDIRFANAGGDFRKAFSMLSSFESEFIDSEIAKCTDFRYYAENYHVIGSEEEGFKTLYPFWDGQEIFYEIVVGIQAKKLPVKILVLKARQLGACLDPGTKVLTSDLRWISIDQVHVGQEIVAVDEGLPLEKWKERRAKYSREYQREWRKSKSRSSCRRISLGKRSNPRRMRTAIVLARRDVYEPVFRLTMDNGQVLVATGSHRFLFKNRNSTEAIWWPVEEMCVGDQIRHIGTNPWEDSATYEDGWFGGLFDGEGCLRAKASAGVEAGVSQVLDNGVYDRAWRYLSSNGYAFREELDRREKGKSSKFGNKPVGKLVVGRMGDIFRLVGKTRPTRFIGKHWWNGKELPGKRGGEDAENPWPKIISIESLPNQRMVDLQTNSKTFIAEGFVSHNSTFSEGMIFHKTIFREGCNSLVVAQDPGQADYLFGMSRTAYDMLPWWLRPEARYEAKGRYIVFDRKDPMERLTNPGLKSQVFVEAANKMTGVAVGRTVHAAHMSELSNWPNDAILAEQIFPTMNAPDELAIMESTARGRKNFWHDFWVATVEKKTEWTPVFIEWFRAKKYFLMIPEGVEFKLNKDEEGIKKRVKEVSKIDLTNEQFYWRRKKIQEFEALQGSEFKFYQEYCSTWMEAFQGTGVCAFNRKKLQSILETQCVRPRWYGEATLDIKGEKQHPKIRLVEVDEETELPVQEGYGGRLYVWEQPEEGETYYIGSDVAHGVPGGDFSVAQILKIGRRLEPDVQVGEWRGWINPGPFGHVLVALGYWYNQAQLAIECNDVGNATNAEVMRVLQYENLFRWKHYDKIKNFITDFFGWFTNVKTRDLIIAKFREFMDENMVVIRSEMLIDECFDFASVEGSRFEGQATKDDRVMAFMIGLFCAHDSDFGIAASLAPRKDNPQEKNPAKRKDFSNTDFSPFHDAGKVMAILPYEEKREVPEDYSLHRENSSESEDAWKCL